MIEKKRKKNYINNKDFHLVMKAYRVIYDKAIEEGKPTPTQPRYFGEAIKMMTTKIASKPCWSGYSFLDEMKDDAMMTCITYAHRYDPIKAEASEQGPNPFSYFTMVIINAFRQRLNTEEKQRYIKAILYKNSSAFLESNADSDFNDDSIDSIIYRFERKQAEKKIKSKAKLEKNSDELENIIDDLLEIV